MDIKEMEASAIREGVVSGKFTAKEVVTSLFERIMLRFNLTLHYVKKVL